MFYSSNNSINNINNKKNRNNINKNKNNNTFSLKIIITIYYTYTSIWNHAYKYDINQKQSNVSSTIFCPNELGIWQRSTSECKFAGFLELT